MSSDPVSPTIRSRRFAHELRRLREQAGLTGDEAADRLGWSSSKISRIETNRIGLKRADLIRLLDLYEVSPGHRDELQALASEPTGIGLLRVRSSSLTAELSSYIGEEAAASSVWNWEPQIVPGLLQTEGYARAILEGFKTVMPTTREEVERRVNVRLARKRLLTRTPPLQFSAVIDESVLHRRIGSHSVMKEQLEYLTEASSIPHVKLRILAFDGEHPVGTGSFSLIQFPQAHRVAQNDLVEVEQLARNYDTDQETETLQYQRAFARLEELALGQEESRELISRLAQEIWS
jgi:transcriptional regulator with XRE-family HTH domain